jgi:hypothetical protein
MQGLGKISVHPDGRRLAIVGYQQQAELWVMKILPPNAKPSR